MTYYSESLEDDEYYETEQAVVQSPPSEPPLSRAAYVKEQLAQGREILRQLGVNRK